jgi:stage III sporulation protein SpoIIIAA
VITPATPEIRVTDDLTLLLDVMPPGVRNALAAHPRREDLVEVVLDLGRPPEARFSDRGEDLSPQPVTRQEIEDVVERVGRFGKDNRAGIEATLHRISALRNRDGAVVGLTCRVGRAVYGTVNVIRDVIEAGRSTLLLGRPGVGKTTLLREAARVLADELGKRVVVVDTSNEIAGDGDIPHSGIGRARRMQVPSPEAQHAVMIEAVENHMPEVIVIDEIGTAAEALAARTIAERGVQLIATAHGNTLENLLQNPTLSDLVGGIQAVTLSDEEARRRGTQKTVLERKAPPTFDVVIEIQAKDRLAVHHGVGEVIDNFLRDFPPTPEVRLRHRDGRVEVQPAAAPAASEAGPPTFPGLGEAPERPRLRTGGLRRRRIQRIFPFAVSRNRLERAIRKLDVPAKIVQELREADLVLTTKAHERRQSKRLRDAQARGLPIFLLRSNTIAQMEKFLAAELGGGRNGGRNGGRGGPAEGPASMEAREMALKEVERGLDEVLAEGHPVELPPQSRNVRRLQHELVSDSGLASRSRGQEPFRRVVIYPN